MRAVSVGNSQPICRGCLASDIREAHARHRQRALIDACGVDPLFMRFNRWEMLRGCEEYLLAAEAVRTCAEGDSLAMLTGKVGRGKSQSMATAVLQSCYDGRQARLVPANSLVDELKARYKDKHGDSAHDWLQKWLRPHLLAIDDVHRLKHEKPNTMMRFEWLLDRRCTSYRPTILAGNLASDEISRVLGAPIADRINGGGGEIEFLDWPSFRGRDQDDDLEWGLSESGVS